MQYWKQETLDTDDEYNARQYVLVGASEFCSKTATCSQPFEYNMLPIIWHMEGYKHRTTQIVMVIIKMPILPEE